MAAHDMWKTTDLIPLLKERGVDLSTVQVYRLVTDKPERKSGGNGSGHSHDDDY